MTPTPEGKRLSYIADQLGLHYTEAAQAAGVHITTWYRWIAGDTRVPKTALKMFEMMLAARR
jgi:predicted transcriptional regulator